MQLKKPACLPVVLITLLLIPVSGFSHPADAHIQSGFSDGMAHALSGMDHVVFYLALGLLLIMVPAGKRKLAAITGITAVVIGSAVAFTGVPILLLVIIVLLLSLKSVLSGNRLGRNIAILFAALSVSSHSVIHLFILSASTLSAAFVLGLLFMQIAFLMIGIGLGLRLKKSMSASIMMRHNKS